MEMGMSGAGGNNGEWGKSTIRTLRHSLTIMFTNNSINLDHPVSEIYGGLNRQRLLG